MTKARTEAQKRRDRKARIDAAGLPALPSIKKRKARGRERMKDIQTEADADIPAYAARCRHNGMPVNDATIRAAKAEWMGCNAGKAMASVVQGEAERKELWGAIHHMRKVQLAYDRAIGAPSRHAQCLRIMLPLEALHADATTPPADLRTDEDKHRQAVSAWMQLQGWLGCADAVSSSICKRVVIDDERCPDAAAMVKALHCVADGVAGRRIVYRGA